MTPDPYNMSMDDDGICSRCGNLVTYKGDWFSVKGGWNRYGRCSCEGTFWVEGKFTTTQPGPKPTTGARKPGSIRA